jgi:hypothetical protein
VISVSKTYQSINQMNSYLINKLMHEALWNIECGVEPKTAIRQAASEQGIGWGEDLEAIVIAVLNAINS